MRRQRYAKIVATIGPASSGPERLRELFLAVRLFGTGRFGRANVGRENQCLRDNICDRQVLRYSPTSIELAALACRPATLEGPMKLQGRG